MESRNANLLVISDLHLGEQIGTDAEETAQIDHALVTFLDYHRIHRRDDRPWRLVVNGDMVDFIGVCLMPADVGWLTDLHPDDHLYGLGNGPHAATMKMERVVAHHEAVFRALARFVGAGNELSMVIGNHDADFHWPEVQKLLRDALVYLWKQESPDAAANEVGERVSFHPWFYMQPGVAWIEHGHQYDPYCSFDDVLEPATDEVEIDLNVGAAILKYVTNHFSPDTSKYWGGGFLTYLQAWADQGLSRAVSMLGAYGDMVHRLVQNWRERRPARVARRRARARTRLARLAKRFRIPEERLFHLMELQHRPVVSDLSRLLLAVQLDRLLLLLAGPFLVLLPLLLVPWSWMPWVLGATVVLLAAWTRIAVIEREPVDPRAAMRTVARRIRAVARVPIVVFGHSHQPEAAAESDGWTFNTGTWAPHAGGSAFTHVRILHTSEGMRARLCQWRDGAANVFDDKGHPSMATMPVQP